MKATDVIGWVHQGGVYCPDCAPEAGLPEGPEEQEKAEWGPMFASGEYWGRYACDRCGRIVAEPCWLFTAQLAASRVDRLHLEVKGPDSLHGPRRIEVTFRATLAEGLEFVGPDYAEWFVLDVITETLRRFGLFRAGWCIAGEEWEYDEKGRCTVTLVQGRGA